MFFYYSVAIGKISKNIEINRNMGQEMDYRGFPAKTRTCCIDIIHKVRNNIQLNFREETPVF